jgi:NAD(P)-dependent dehydrogenase (short-subunit alcohol dehydrogenase family)
MPIVSRSETGRANITTTMIMMPSPPPRRGRGHKCHVTFTATFLLYSMIFLLIPSRILASDYSTKSGSTNVILVGGSSGMGKAAALEVIKNGGRCLLISRSNEKLQAARAELISQVPNAQVEIQALDASNEDAVEAFARTLPEDEYDGLVVSAAGRAPHGPFATLPTKDTRDMMETKVWTAYHCAKHFGPKLCHGGGIVFVAGILNRRPGLYSAPLAIANGALEGISRSLALEWGPKLRVNCLSPGFCDTERFDHMPAERKKQMMANTAASLPLQKIGQPSDMGKAIYYLLTAQFCTGVILDVDGGHGIRQYANAETDPMRKKNT